MPTLKVVDPTAPRVTVERHRMSDRPTTLNGTVVGFREFWPKFDVFTRAFEELVSANYDVRGTERVDGTHPRSGVVLERWQELQSQDIRMNCDTCAYRVLMPGFEDKLGLPQTPHHHPDDPTHTHAHHQH